MRKSSLKIQAGCFLFGVEYTLEKRGRVVTGFVFTYKEKAGAATALPAPKRLKLFPFPTSGGDYSPAQIAYSSNSRYGQQAGYFEFAQRMNKLPKKEQRRIEEEEALKLMSAK